MGVTNDTKNDHGPKDEFDAAKVAGPGLDSKKLRLAKDKTDEGKVTQPDLDLKPIHGAKNESVAENGTLAHEDYISLFMHTDAAKNFFKGMQSVLFHIN